MVETVIVGERDTSRAASVRKNLENLIQSVNKSTFDIATLLFEVKKNGYFNAWGFNTFQEYVKGLDIKARKAQYLVRIVDVMDEVGVQREEYEPLGIGKLREIASLDPKGVYLNPETKAETPMSNFIVGFIEQGKTMELDEIKQHVRTLKGLVGENDLTWLNICVKRATVEQTIRPALELAKANIGTVGKDDEGMATDASDGAAFEVIAVEYLNNPANQPFPEEIAE